MHAMIGKPLSPRCASYSSFLDAEGQVLDQGIALFFPAPHSYTGEDVLELQGHGGTAVLQMILQRCLEFDVRLAQPGEFTQRAFLSGKLDLAQAEGVADLIDATTSQAARSAMRSLQGEFSQAVHHLVEQLVRLRMLVEAMLDFPEEDVESISLVQRESQLVKLQSQLDEIISAARQGSLLREGAHVVLIGQPNVGKSSLLNRLSGTEVALVSEIPGTTRDIIRQAIQIDGVPLHIMDTAGLRESGDVVELMGIARTRDAFQKADVILVILDANRGMTADDQKILDELPPNISRLYVFNKIDLLATTTTTTAHVEERGAECHVYLSAKTGDGLELLRAKLLEKVGWHHEAGTFMGRERHMRSLRSAREHLGRASTAPQAEIFAEELRLAQEQLNLITGEFTADDLLGQIFSRFCIGK